MITNLHVNTIFILVLSFIFLLSVQVVGSQTGGYRNYAKPGGALLGGYLQQATTAHTGTDMFPAEGSSEEIMEFCLQHAQSIYQEMIDVMVQSLLYAEYQKNVFYLASLKIITKHLLLILKSAGIYTLQVYANKNLSWREKGDRTWWILFSGGILVYAMKYCIFSVFAQSAEKSNSGYSANISYPR